MPLNIEAIKQLVADLRNPALEQTQGCLRSPDNPNAKCCLGHACDTYQRLTGKGDWYQLPTSGVWLFRTESNQDGNYSVLPIEVKNFFGFSDSDPLLPNNKTAVELNDVKHYTLAQIADEFEQQYLKGAK